MRSCQNVRIGAFNHRTHGDQLVAASLYKVPARKGVSDARLPTEQWDALKERHRIVVMRLRKATENKDLTKVAALSTLKLRLEADMQRTADGIVKQWQRDERHMKARNEG